MIILKNKIPDEKWKKYILLKIPGLVKNEIYYPESKTEQYIVDSLTKLTFNENVLYNRNAIYSYIETLEKIKSSSTLSESDEKKIDLLVEKLLRLETYNIIGNKFYPQITVTKKTIYRFYYNPLFNWNFKHIKALYSFGFIDTKFKVYEFDVNGALIRAFFYILYKKYKNDKFRQLYQTEKDIYDIVSSLIGLNNNLQRKTKKNLIIQLLIGKEKSLPLIEKHLVQRTKFFNFIYDEILNLDNIKLTMIHHVLIVNDLLKSGISELSFFNYDGGIIVAESKVNLPNYYKLEEIKLRI